MRKLSLLIAILICLSMFSVPALAADGFPDMKDHWAASSVKVLTEKNIVAGWDGKFHPNDQVKANEYIKMVVTALGFIDIQNYPGDWARNYIKKAVELGLVLSAEIADYNEPINRAMMAKIAMRALQDEVVPDYIMAYKGLVSDYNDLDANIRLDALKCIEKGIIKGMPDGSFRPDYLSTRAEAATVIHRMISQEEREKAKPIFATPDPEFEAFMASDEAKEYCSVELIDQVVDGKIIFGGRYQQYTGERLLPVFHNAESNKEIYETLRILVMYAKEYNHFVRVFLSSNSSSVFIGYYENNRYPNGPNWSTTYNFMFWMNVIPTKYVDEQEQYTYYLWKTGNFVMDTTENWEDVNYREPEITNAFNVAFKSIYGTDLGQKFFAYAISEYDKERDFWFRQGKKEYTNFFLEYSDDLGGLEVYNNNGNARALTVLFGTNKVIK